MYNLKVGGYSVGLFNGDEITKNFNEVAQHSPLPVELQHITPKGNVPIKTTRGHGFRLGDIAHMKGQ